MVRQGLVLLLLSGLSPAVVAQVPSFVAATVECVPAEGHALALVGMTPDPGDHQVRVYFRRDGHGDFYWVPADQEAPGAYWAILPVPEPDNIQAEYYAAVLSAGGELLGQSPPASVPVTDQCEVELDDEQEDRSRNLTVGETSLGQKYLKLAWWQCEGLERRIDVFGEERDDEGCLPVIVPWYQRPAFWIPVGVATVGGVVLIEDEPSPSPPVSPATP